MLEIAQLNWTTLLWWMLMFMVTGRILGTLEGEDSISSCEPGYYCPKGSLVQVPCPSGTFGPLAGAWSLESCISCPPHHYGPRPGLTACRPCGPRAHQDQPGQNHCVCQGEGQRFQPSDGHCVCSLGYTLRGDEDVCVPSVYEICRGSQTRGQHGDCLSSEEWRQHCSQQVCPSPEDSEGFDDTLGLCVCSPAFGGGEACGPWCEGWAPRPAAWLVCAGDLRLLYGDTSLRASVPTRVLDSLLKPWTWQESLMCTGGVHFSHKVYLVRTTESGFVGVVNAAPEDLHQLFQETLESSPGPPTPPDGTESSGSASEEEGPHWARWSKSRPGNYSRAGLLNPTTCLHLGDILLFSVTPEHHPQYDRDNLYNTNEGFDWGPFRSLAQDMSVKGAHLGLFLVLFHEPGVYAFKLSSNPHKPMFVKVMPSGGQCYEAGPFFPTIPHHVTRMGISRKRNLLLHPDWLVIWGLLAGAVLMLGMCVTLLALFREYGWPQKVPIPVCYRALQLRYSLDDYSSKGSSLTAVKKVHRNQRASESEGTAQTVPLMAHEFWDYEQQVDLEAFSSTMFFEVLLKHSMSVTARLGQLRTEVRELYQVVAGWFRALRSLGGRATGTIPPGYEELRRHVEKERGRRRALATQLGRLLDGQLRVLQMEMMARTQAQQDFGARLREALRLLEKPPLHVEQPPQHGEQPWDQQLQHAQDRLSALASQMGDLASRECQRQGAWAILGEGTGAQLLCPTRGIVLTKEEIIAADGVIVAMEAISVDPCTGLLVPKPNARMRVPSGHTMPVPSDFFLHPETGRLLPMAGNVAYNPASSTLAITADSRAAEPARWDTPLLPFVPYPLSRHGPITCQLRGLRPGQRMVLGGPMCDPKTGVLVPILAVTIHPVTGLVFPLGGVHMCPLTGLPRPIQVGAAMQEPEGGSIALVTGVSLNPLTGEVVPVGGVLLGESFVEPLSGREALVRGAGLRGGKLVPHAGGYQALLDSQALATRMRVAELLQVAVRSSGRGLRGGVRAAGAEMKRAWRSSQHCLLQMVCRLEIMQDWAWWLAQDAGVQGEIQFPGSDLQLPALPGLEYPDPGGSGLRVPVLGSQLDWASGRMVPLAGTMEDANGGGLVPIRIGSQTVDPDSGAVGPVVGARFDSLRKFVIPITASDRLAEGRKETVLMDILERECSLRSTFWMQQRQQEEELLRDLDRSLHHCFQAAAQSMEHVQDCQAQWRQRERQFQATVAEMNQRTEAEAHRSAEGRSHLHLLLPGPVFLILTGDDEQQRERQIWWQEELAAGLERISVTIDRLQQERDRWMEQHSMERPLRRKEQWEQLNSRLVELEVALAVQHCVREHSQLRMDTAKAILSGSFWYKDFGLPYIRGPSETQGTEAVVQHRVLPLLQRLLYLLEEQKQGNKESPGTSTHSLKPVDKSKSSGPWTNQLYSQDSQKKAPQTVLQGKDVLPAMKESTHLSPPAGGRQPFIDLLDAQWECEGELVPLIPDCLNTQEVLVYQYGVSLLQALHTHAEAPALTLQISASLPPNSYHGNPFCNSFFYQESGSILFVRRQRLRSAGSFSLLLLHCVSHIIVGHMGTEDHQFQRVFFRMLEFTLTEGFESKLATRTAEDLQYTGQEEIHLDQGKMSESGLSSLLVNRMQGSACRPLSDNEHVPEQLEKHRRASDLWHLEGLLRDVRSEVRRSCRKAQPHSPQ